MKLDDETHLRAERGQFFHSSSRALAEAKVRALVHGADI